ncbi:MAG: hypothetical protein AMJ79_14985, partial [Phycisphaerae bacterium SM23_30]
MSSVEKRGNKLWVCGAVKIGGGMAILFFIFWIIMGAGVIHARDSLGPGQAISDKFNVQSLFQARQRYDKWPRSMVFEETSDGRAYIEDEIIVKYKEQTAAVITSKLSHRQALKDLRLTDSIDRLHQRFKVKKIEPLFKDFKAKRGRYEKLPTKPEKQLTNEERRNSNRLRQASQKADLPALDRIYKIKLELGPGQSLKDASAAYQNDPGVEYAQLNYKYELFDLPNDPFFSLQWSLDNQSQEYPPNLDRGSLDSDIDAPEAWNLTTGGSDIVVAVIDTGVDYNHRDLDDNIWINED